MIRFAIAAIALATVALPAQAQVRQKGYTTNNGVYVAPTVRTRPNSTILDNYSTRPNVNPYSGRAGTVNPYSTPTYRPYSPPATSSYKPKPVRPLF